MTDIELDLFGQAAVPHTIGIGLPAGNNRAGFVVDEDGLVDKRHPVAYVGGPDEGIGGAIFEDQIRMAGNHINRRMSAR